MGFSCMNMVAAELVMFEDSAGTNRIALHRGEHRTKPVPPIPHGFVADIDTVLEQQIFNLSRGQRITDVHHRREADHLGRTVEIAKLMTHRRRLRNAPPLLKPIYSDNALS